MHAGKNKMAYAARTSIFSNNNSNWRSSSSGHEYINVNFFFTAISYEPFCSQTLRMASSPRYIIALNIVPLIIDYLQLKYQGKYQTPFETHPKTMSVAIACCLGYYWTCKAEERFSSWYHIPPTPASVAYVLRCCKVVMGNLSMASTASVLLPDSVRPVLFLFCLILSATELFDELLWLYRRISGIIRRQFSARNTRRHVFNSFAEHGYILPL